jgi:hypothetical protein
MGKNQKLLPVEAKRIGNLRNQSERRLSASTFHEGDVARFDPELLSEQPLSQAQTFATSLQEVPELVGIFHALQSNNPAAASIECRTGSQFTQSYAVQNASCCG